MCLLLRLAVTIVALGLGAPLGAATPAPAPIEHLVDWHTSPLDLDLRGLNGERLRFRCTRGKPPAGQVVGSGRYTDGSSICAAAVHAGAFRAAAGGLVALEMRAGEARYHASLSHYVQSAPYEEFWSGSFLVIRPNPDEVPP